MHLESNKFLGKLIGCALGENTQNRTARVVELLPLHKCSPDSARALTSVRTIEIRECQPLFRTGPRLMLVDPTSLSIPITHQSLQERFSSKDPASSVGGSVKLSFVKISNVSKSYVAVSLNLGLFWFFFALVVKTRL